MTQRDELESYLEWVEKLELRPRYFVFDEARGTGGMLEVSLDQAISFNEKGYGVFHTLNEFSGPRRKSYLAKIHAVMCELDHGTKEEQLAVIDSNQLPLYPSLIVESKRGYQLYWIIENEMSVHEYDSIMSDVIDFFGADKNAKDVTRVLRVPGFYHHKDPSNPYLITTFRKSHVTYPKEFFLYAFKKPKTFLDETQKARSQFLYGNDLFDRIYNLNQMEALEKLSGSYIVLGETYEFRKQSNGNYNIWVNGKSTANFIDKEFRIGSLSGGGPTVYQWLRWLGCSSKEIFQWLDEHYPGIVQGGSDATGNPSAHGNTKAKKALIR